MNYPMRTVFAHRSQYRDLPGNVFSTRRVYPVDYGVGVLTSRMPSKKPEGMLLVVGNRVEAPYPKSHMPLEKNALQLLAEAAV